jgi:sugar phosphate isomerase/epimerase
MEEKKIQVHVPYPVLLEKLEDVLEMGINPEVYMDGRFLVEAVPEDLKTIRDEFARRSLRITMHGPYIDMNPGSPDEFQRKRTEERYERVFEVVSDLRPKNVVLHAGYSERRFRGDEGLWLEQSLKTWPRFVKEAERLDTTIAAENIFEKTPDTLKMLVARVDSPNFRVCIDSGHLKIFSKAKMEEWFRELGPFIAEVHIHDNFGKNDDHLPVGEGSIDFESFFRHLKAYSKDPVYTIEPHGDGMIERSLKAVRKYIGEG